MSSEPPLVVQVLVVFAMLTSMIENYKHNILVFQGQTSVDSTSPDDSASNTTKNSTSRGPPEDILAALEKIPGVGSLRSSCSVGSSLPSLSLVEKTIVLRREEESSHSLTVASATKVNQVQYASEVFTGF